MGLLKTESVQSCVACGVDSCGPNTRGWLFGFFHFSGTVEMIHWIFGAGVVQLEGCKRQEQACCLPETPAAVSVFIATGSVRAAEDERALPGASVRENSRLPLLILPALLFPPLPLCRAGIPTTGE